MTLGKVLTSLNPRSHICRQGFRLWEMPLKEAGSMMI